MSEIYLWWIKSAVKARKAWVDNRRNAIRALTDIGLWRFVPGEHNSSDIGTRKGIILLILEVMYYFGMDPIFVAKPIWLA